MMLSKRLRDDELVTIRDINKAADLLNFWHNTLQHISSGTYNANTCHYMATVALNYQEK